MHLPVILRINKVTCEVCTLSVSLFLMTGRHFRITDAFTDVIGAAGGHRGRFAPVCSFPLSGVSIAQIGAAAAGWLSQKPAGLARTSKRCAPHHYPLGGHSGAVICLLCAISAKLLSMLYSLITEVRNEQNLGSHTRKMSPEKNPGNFRDATGGYVKCLETHPA